MASIVERAKKGPLRAMTNLIISITFALVTNVTSWYGETNGTTLFQVHSNTVATVNGTDVLISSVPVGYYTERWHYEVKTNKEEWTELKVDERAFLLENNVFTFPPYGTLYASNIFYADVICVTNKLDATNAVPTFNTNHFYNEP
jgi:hypothetical protein